MAKFAIAIALALFLFFSGCVSESAPVNKGQGPGDVFWKGSENPRLIVYEYSDFQCPVCAKTQPAIKEFISKYQGKGVRLVFKHSPLESIHEYARGASIASVCAGRQGKFWEYHDMLFSSSQEYLAKPTLITFAKRLGLDQSKFTDCLDSQSAASVVDADLADALSRGFKGTPTFVVGDIVLVGRQSAQALGEAADKALAGK